MGISIKAFRARTTYEHIAKRVGVRRETILFIERGEYNLFIKLAHDTAKAWQTT